MLSIIWAFGAMLVLMLIIFVLPLSYTKKGKTVVVLAGFLLALGGLAAAATFPLWQTSLMILALSFFAAYFLDNRLAKVLYTVKNEVSVVDEFEDFDSSLVENKTDDLEFMNLADVEIAATSVNTTDTTMNDDDLPLVKPIVSRSVELEKDKNDEGILDDSELAAGYLADIESLLEDSHEETVELEQLSVLNLETIEKDDYEDLELFVVKDTAVESHLIEEDDLEEITVKSNWLDDLDEISVIEDKKEIMLNGEDDCEDLEQFVVNETPIQDDDSLEEITVDSGWMDELAELTVIEDVERDHKETDRIQEIPFDDFELEELFADKESAASQDNDIDEKKSVKELNLQK
nr:hypothetical protein [Neobacillus sp. Marseille-Q6967]